MQLHHGEGYLISFLFHQTANMEYFHSCQGLLFITFSSLIGTSVLYIARVVAGTCKQSQITWGCFPTFLFDIFWNEVISSSRRCCFMHDYIVLHSVWRDKSRAWKTYGTLLWIGGYERRARMSLGDKTIIMLNLCHALKAVPCEGMLTLSQTQFI